MDNVVSLVPPGPAKVAKRRKPPKFQPDIKRALEDRQKTVWHARAVLELIDYAQPSQEMSWRHWNAVLGSVDAAAELLRKIDDLGEAEELAKVGAALKATS
jgi:hypothetical protein